MGDRDSNKKEDLNNTKIEEWNVRTSKNLCEVLIKAKQKKNHVSIYKYA